MYMYMYSVYFCQDYMYMYMYSVYFCQDYMYMYMYLSGDKIQHLIGLQSYSIVEVLLPTVDDTERGGWDPTCIPTPVGRTLRVLQRSELTCETLFDPSMQNPSVSLPTTIEDLSVLGSSLVKQSCKESQSTRYIGFSKYR